MKHRLFAAIAIAFVFSILFFGFTRSDYFKINKSFELFGAVFREVVNNYVLEIDPEIMVKNGVGGMLATLDPYTDFFDSDYSEDLDILTHGVYTGFGFTISLIDDEMVIVALSELNSAYLNGVRVGDKLYKIDSTVVINLSSDEIRNFTRGDVGSIAQVSIIREGIKDTLQMSLSRESINLRNIRYYGITSDSLAYIKIDGFTRHSASEVRNAYMRMKNEGNIKGLILDFRDNPGGLLSSAISIAELFLPKGSLIVSTKGRNNKNVMEYVSTSDPIDDQIPLAVLINYGSASASEIVAGAIQDLDRGIVVGRRSFGKGLVQSVIDMPFNSFLKLTTAKYYTPSGRCIQKISFGEQYNKQEITPNTDTTIFFTNNGRKVYELTGILPDTVVRLDTIPDILRDLADKHLLFNFATFYASRFDSINSNFEVDSKVFSEFEDYLKKRDYLFLSKSGDYIAQIEEAVSANNSYSKKTKDEIVALKESISEDDKKDMRKYREDISKYLRYEILRRFHTNSKIIELYLDEDKDLNTARQLILSGQYSRILKSN